MALLPYLFGDVYGNRYDSLNRLIERELNELSRPSADYAYPLLAGYFRPVRHGSQNDSGVSTIEQDKDNFKVNLDVQQFKPEEINVKVVDDYVTVEGKHEERKDKHGFISRQFTRRYKLPQNVNVQGIKSSLSSDGILSIVAPKKAIDDGKSRSIPVVQTNQPAIKPSDKKDSGDDKMES